MVIFLIGYMGSGKTTLGKQLAKHLNLDFIDLDKYIETKMEYSMPEIFNKFGEKLFRKEEHACLKEVCNKNDIVVSTGGGTPCFYNNMELMNATGTTIFLNLPIKTLVARLSRSTKIRPLVHNKTKEELYELVAQNLEDRMNFYKKAKHSIYADSISCENILPIFQWDY